MWKCPWYILSTRRGEKRFVARWRIILIEFNRSNLIQKWKERSIPSNKTVSFLSRWFPPLAPSFAKFPRDFEEPAKSTREHMLLTSSWREECTGNFQPDNTVARRLNILEIGVINWAERSAAALLDLKEVVIYETPLSRNFRENEGN